MGNCCQGEKPQGEIVTEDGQKATIEQIAHNEPERLENEYRNAGNNNELFDQAYTKPPPQSE